ncbi:unnamed protein product [Strongylus vulgaris]|uniref:Protein kinase domain-containing protein n=1 Tax=Strongylus vulgaris TaxID=40348 RepID=A0A3P7KKE7_STRVU|nr:unnamed protein product [Strongylus vulgaris]
MSLGIRPSPPYPAPRAYGEVHLVRNPFSRKYIPDDVIALKVIDLEHRREDSKQKFRNEVALQNALTPLRHPNIVKCFGSNYELELNQLQILLEYVPGDDLRTIIRKSVDIFAMGTMVNEFCKQSRNTFKKSIAF